MAFGLQLFKFILKLLKIEKENEQEKKIEKNTNSDKIL